MSIFFINVTYSLESLLSSEFGWSNKKETTVSKVRHHHQREVECIKFLVHNNNFVLYSINLLPQHQSEMKMDQEQGVDAQKDQPHCEAVTAHMHKNIIPLSVAAMDTC